jgi:hypothetical protein
MTHPLNCETCTKFWSNGSGGWVYGCRNSGSIWDMDKRTVAHMSDVGCASHSKTIETLNELTVWETIRDAKDYADFKARITVLKNNTDKLKRDVNEAAVRVK